MMDQVAECTGPIWDEMKVPREQVAEFGRHPIENHGQFHMTVAALRLSSHVNGVAKRHGEVSREIWRTCGPSGRRIVCRSGTFTNGVHLATWMARDVMELLDAKAGKHWGSRLDEPGFWDCVLSIDDGELWRAHHDEAPARSASFASRRGAVGAAVEGGRACRGRGTLLDPNALTIGFARGSRRTSART
jgi:starch phosphorylase